MTTSPFDRLPAECEPLAEDTPPPVPARSAASTRAPTLATIPRPLDWAEQLVWGQNHFLPFRRLQMPCEPWSAGVAIHTGPVRPNNEDYAVVFKIGEISVAILGDGCGGVPHGRDAAFHAVSGAAVSVSRQLAWLPLTVPVPDLRGIALQAHYDASDTIADYAERTGIDSVRALRCTLIVALITHEEVAYAHLGDGGLRRYRPALDECTELLDAQRVSGFNNLLAASMGARIEGEPVVGRADRRREDLLWLASDGITDRTDALQLSRKLVEQAERLQGDLQAVAEQMLDELADYHDERGPVFDDNLSLIMVADPPMAKVAQEVDAHPPMKLVEQKVSAPVRPALRVAASAIADA